MQEPQTQGITVTREQIGSYLSSLGERGRNPSTVSSYRKKLELLYAALPGGRIGRGTLRQWREQLLDQGYSPSTVNTSVSAANSFLEWLGCREFQLTGRLSCGRDAQLELTRSEYLRLLSTARALRQERVYLLIKLFTSTGLPVHELEQVTVEAAGEGVLLLPGEAMPQRLPDCLRRELLDYARRQGISSGPIFVTRTGRPCGRAGVSVSIRRLCRDAQVPPEKGNPRCLRKLYYTTRAEIEATVAQLVEQTHERLLDDDARAVADLAEFVENCKKPLFFVGDGAALCYNKYSGVPGVLCVPPALRNGRAAAVAYVAKQMAQRGEAVLPEALLPDYHRLSQAERERAERLAAEAARTETPEDTAKGKD